MKKLKKISIIFSLFILIFASSTLPANISKINLELDVEKKDVKIWKSNKDYVFIDKDKKVATLTKENAFALIRNNKVLYWLFTYKIKSDYKVENQEFQIHFYNSKDQLLKIDTFKINVDCLKKDIRVVKKYMRYNKDFFESVRRIEIFPLYKEWKKCERKIKKNKKVKKHKGKNININNYYIFN